MRHRFGGKVLDNDGNRLSYDFMSDTENPNATVTFYYKENQIGAITIPRETITQLGILLIQSAAVANYIEEEE